MFGFDFAPRNYATCGAQLLSIQQNAALFSILGTTFGGNGIQTFALPDLRGRTYMGQQQGSGLSNYVLGESIGIEDITLLLSNLPAHNHLFNVNNGAATGGVPGPSAVLSQGPLAPTTSSLYSTTTANSTMNANELTNTGGNQPISILQPYLTINFSIALNGIFPSRN